MKKILIIEDDPVVQKLVNQILSDENYLCSLAEDGQSGRDIYGNSLESEEPYNLIILDIVMPIMDGFQFLTNLRQDEEDNGLDLEERVPIIIITSHARHYAEAYMKGCNDFILKPIDTNTLLEKVKLYIDGISTEDTD
ncbi:MAG: CheY-like chemotaxis protein [Lysobacterales bacterium]|jgi:CheY-like chemotaxis protein